MDGGIEKILEYLRCPTCKGKNILFQKRKNYLICKKNKSHLFYIKKGIPRFILPKYWDKFKRETTRSFSYKWGYKSIKNYGFEEKTSRFQRRWYLKRYGLTKNKFDRFIKKQHFILDAGCGTGWTSNWFNEFNAKSIIFAIDISKSVEKAQSNLKKINNAIALQADIDCLPFPYNFFDFISCDQVLHHTPNPFFSFKQLIKHLKKNGILFFYVYKKKPLLREVADIIIREKTVKMNPRNCYNFARTITLLGKSLSELKTRLYIPESIPLLGIKRGEYDIQRFIYWHFLKCFWNKEWGLEKSIITNFDWYHPNFAYRYTPTEIKQWIEKVGLKIQHFDIGESGISVRVKK